jgi:hypothetical protein
MLVQFFIIGIGNEPHVIIKKMDFLLITHADVGMSAQKIVQRCCAGFLRASQNEIEPLNFAALASKHQSKCKRNFRVRAIVFREALECGASWPRFSK